MSSSAAEAQGVSAKITVLFATDYASFEKIEFPKGDLTLGQVSVQIKPSASEGATPLDHILIQSVGLIAASGLKAAYYAHAPPTTTNAHPVIFVHGYNSSFGDAVVADSI